MIRWLSLISCLLLIVKVNAQTTITGVVTNKDDGKVLVGASVAVKDGLLTVAFGVTNEKGNYSLTFKSEADSLQVSVSGLSFKRQMSRVINKDQQLNVAVFSEAIKLKEIKINPPKIRQLNDTLNYLVDAFADQNDRTIGDVLKKMPGITVKDDGSILYNNKPINKFYIEGKDLLQGRYGIATNNLQSKDVASVQVLENHQPIKALKDKEFTDEGAINLKLKDSAKGVLTSNGQAGAGVSPLLWDNELTAMYFDRGSQHLSTYKGNNTGNDPRAEQLAFYGNPSVASQGASLSVQSPSSPGISQKRYLFNRSNAANLNKLWALDKERQLTANVNYFNDRQQKESFSRSVYYLPADSLLTIEESLASTSYINALDANIQFNANRTNYYLDNTFKFNGKWNSQTGDVFNNSPFVQHLKTPSVQFSNTLNLVKNKGKATFKVLSSQTYSGNPQTLKVSPFLYPELFEGGDLLSTMQQSLKESLFSSRNRVTYGIDHGVFKQNYAVGLNIDLQSFTSELAGLSAEGILQSGADSLKNDIQWNNYEMFFSPEYIYVKNKWRITLGLPFIFKHLDVDYGLTDEDKNLSRFFFNPSLSVRYDLTLLWNVTLRAQRTNSIGGLENGFTGYLLQSYRNLVRNQGDLPEKQSQSFQMDVGYRHPLHAIFMNIGGGYFNNRMNLLYGYEYTDIRSVKQAYQIVNYNRGYNLYGRISKSVDAIASTLTLDATYNSANASQIAQDEVINFKNVNYSLKPSISTKIRTWASFSYNYQYSRSINRTNELRKLRPITNQVQRGQLNLFPIKALILNMALENFNNTAVNGGGRSMNFADLGAKYTYKKVEFNLEYNNVFNARQFISAAYTDITTFYSSYNLRPAQILMKVRFKIR